MGVARSAAPITTTTHGWRECVKFARRRQAKRTKRMNSNTQPNPPETTYPKSCLAGTAEWTRLFLIKREGILPLVFMYIYDLSYLFA